MKEWLQLGLALVCGCSSGPRDQACQSVPRDLLLDVEGTWMPRCGLTDWPATFELPPFATGVPESLPPPFDHPEAHTGEEVGGGTLFTFGAETHGDFLLQTIWADEANPPQVRLGTTGSEGRFDTYCLVDGRPHQCRWNDEESPWISFDDSAPVHAWTVELLDAPVGGFDWTILWARRRHDVDMDTGVTLQTVTGATERLYVHHRSIEVHPRFEGLLWENTTPEFRGANLMIDVVPYSLPIRRQGDVAHVQVRLWNQEPCTIPVEVTFLADGQLVPFVAPDGPKDVWSLEVDPGDREVEIELHDVGSLPSGAPLFVHGVMWPGMPGLGETASGERCVSATAGMMQGTRLGPLAIFE